MTMNSILGGFHICETGLGAKRHKPSAPKLGPMFIQVVSTAFLTVLRNTDKWMNLNAIEQPPLYGLRHLEPAQESSGPYQIFMRPEIQLEFAIIQLKQPGILFLPERISGSFTVHLE